MPEGKRKGWTRDSAFLKYGDDELLDEDFIDEIEDESEEEKPKKKDNEKEDKEKDFEKQRKHPYKRDIYEDKDTYKEDMEQYRVDAMAIIMDTTHFTVRKKQLEHMRPRLQPR